MNVPGRTCPRHYRIEPEVLDRPADVTAETVYVVGGLYGNTAALAEVQALADREVEAGCPRPVLVFNGDFNWFNATQESYRAVNRTVLRHRAVQGNVEAELANPTPGAGCGCVYPAWVPEERVRRSNEIMERLQAVASETPDLSAELAELPRHLTVRVGVTRIGIVHGDPTSLAGWGLAVESVPPPGTVSEEISQWFREGNVRGFATAHTCLPYIQDFEVDGCQCVVANNGATGMPNFQNGEDGVLTRISTRPAPFGRLYGAELEGVHWDAIRVPCTPDAWVQWFEETWPRGSPAWASYHDRIVSGPSHRLADAVRVGNGIRSSVGSFDGV